MLSPDIERDAAALPSSSAPVASTVEAEVELLVCSTCKIGELPEPDALRPGAVLHQKLATAALPAGVRVRAVECLSNCSQGCTIAVRSPGRWTYIYGNIDPETQVETVVDGVTRYAATVDGLVPWRERPQHFKKNCIARIPPMDVTL